jgi:CDP-glycerol glycerophosphotransferase
MATAQLKKVIYDIDDTPRYLTEEIEGYCNLAVAGSSFGVNQYRTAFRYTGEVINVGSSRNDCLVNYDEKKAIEIRKNLNIAEDTKMLLYAPTLRDLDWKSHKKQEKQDIDLKETLKVLRKKTGTNWVCELFKIE